jgi:hypothetical protein
MSDALPEAPEGTPSVDRGLLRVAVEAYARRRRLSYEDAHKVLSGPMRETPREARYRESADRPGQSEEDPFDVPTVA